MNKNNAGKIMKIQTSKKKKDETKSRMEGEGEKRRCVGVGERGGGASTATSCLHA